MFYITSCYVREHIRINITICPASSKFLLSIAQLSKDLNIYIFMHMISNNLISNVSSKYSIRIAQTLMVEKSDEI